ncbi:ribose-5-phosphate isomerase [bacterium]|jgi:ribose 5-phosphate isomerase B|nr:ribose-5-phosphate isomerase [bacterium]MDP6659823.1 RpiB/LacA/LacB family sugar-phosphate isomerase [Candidatus Paceibacterota bacterium]|tara:strand:- start:48637 stop:49083 length:447 start_codon:yes stop_codon:yes gene_type:complete
MKIYFATDHAGLGLKKVLKEFVEDLGHVVEDLGAHELDESDDYPDFISIAAEKVSSNPTDRAIVLGGSGQGEAIVSNRFKNVRAVVYYGGNKEVIKLSREHNDANILSIGARFISAEEAKEVVKIWLETPFSGEERHKRRIEKIEKYG